MEAIREVVVLDTRGTRMEAQSSAGRVPQDGQLRPAELWADCRVIARRHLTQCSRCPAKRTGSNTGSWKAIQCEEWADTWRTSRSGAPF